MRYNGFKKHVSTVWVSALMAATFSSVSASAATEIQETNSTYGPSAGTMVVDAVIGKPLQTVAAVGGLGIWIASLPFTVLSDSTAEAGQKLVIEPFSELGRCLGCTSQQDATRRVATDYGKQTNYGKDPVYTIQSPTYHQAPVSQQQVIIEPYGQ